MNRAAFARAFLCLGLVALSLASCGSPRVTGIPHVSMSDPVNFPDTGPPAHPHQNSLIGPDGLYTGVTVYSDCTGRTPLTTYSAAIDSCMDRPYFVGHNPGVFTPILNYKPGDIVTFWNGNGQPDYLTVVGTRNWVWGDGIPPLLPGARVQFQTCLNSSGTVDRIVDFK